MANGILISDKILDDIYIELKSKTCLSSFIDRNDAIRIISFHRIKIGDSREILEMLEAKGYIVKVNSRCVKLEK